MSKPKKPRGKKYRKDHSVHNKLDNPVAKAVERDKLNRWEKATFNYLSSLNDGQPCKEPMEQILQMICPAMKSIEGWDDPDGVGDVLVAAVEVAADVINDGGWSTPALPIIMAGVKEACRLTNVMPVFNIAIAKQFTDELLVRAKEAA
jgi:hypothetical protein